MINPAKGKLIFSGMIDFIVASLFLILLTFAVYLVLTLLGVIGDLTANLDNNYQFGDFTAAVASGITGLLIFLVIGIAIAVIIGMFSSFSFVKSCFKVAKMDLATAKNKIRTLNGNGSAQCFFAMVSFGIAVLIALNINLEEYTKLFIAIAVISGIVFLSSGILKLSSAKLIKNTDLPMQRHRQLGYYYINQ